MSTEQTYKMRREVDSLISDIKSLLSEDEYGFDKWEAWQVNSQVGTMRIGNIVDPNYTVIAKFPKKFLPN